MWSKLVLLTALVSQVASSRILSADFVENVRDYEIPQGRIVSGWDAEPGQIPWQASLRAINQQWQALGCGASVIHEQWVITAAHCTANYRQVTVRAGLVAVSSAEYIGDSWEWYNHPSYNANSPGTVQLNDVSLIKLDVPMTFTRNLQRIRVQPLNDAFISYDNQKLIASGWGRIWTGGSVPTNLQWTYLRGIENSECSRLFGTRTVNENTICARWYNLTTQSVCQGDSGGPLAQVNSQGTPTLVGVTSFVAGVNSGGCHSGHPGGFIRPGPFHAWFTEVTNVDFEALSDERTTTSTSSTTTTTRAPSTTTSTRAPSTTTTRAPSTTTAAPTTTVGPTPEKPDTDDEDDDVSELLKKLQVKVQVQVTLKKYKKADGKVTEVEEIQYL